MPNTSPDQSDDADAAGLEQDEVAAARAQLKARAGAKGRRGGKAVHVGSGQGQVRADWPDCGNPVFLVLSIVLLPIILARLFL